MAVRSKLMESYLRNKKSAEGKDLKPDGSNYDKDAYEKASNTVDVCICRVHEGKLQMLVIKRKFPPFADMWAIPGGFIDIAKKEGIYECAVRELEEETQVKNVPIRQLGTYGDPDRDPRMRIISTVYYAFLSEEKVNEQIIEARDDAKEYKWLTIGKRVPKLAFDHNQIVRDLMERIAYEITSQPTAFELVNSMFTWNDLQEVFEAVLGMELVTSNFRRKIKSMYKIEEIKETLPVVKGRPRRILKYKGTKPLF